MAEQSGHPGRSEGNLVKIPELDLIAACRTLTLLMSLLVSGSRGFLQNTGCMNFCSTQISSQYHQSVDLAVLRGLDDIPTQCSLTFRDNKRS